MTVRVVCALIVRDGRVLMTRRRERGQCPGLWENPGGKVEAGESLKHALQREMYEELRLSVQVREPVATHTFFWEDDVRLFLFRCEPEADPRPTEEVAEVYWFSPIYALYRLPCVPSFYEWWAAINRHTQRGRQA